MQKNQSVTVFSLCIGGKIHIVISFEFNPNQSLLTIQLFTVVKTIQTKQDVCVKTTSQPMIQSVPVTQRSRPSIKQNQAESVCHFQSVFGLIGLFCCLFSFVVSGNAHLMLLEILQQLVARGWSSLSLLSLLFLLEFFQHFSAIFTYFCVCKFFDFKKL